MSLAQGINTPTRPRIEPGSPDPESDALTTRSVRPHVCSKRLCVEILGWSYLSKHLMLKHGFNKLDAHSTACQAPRGNIQPEEYYDDVSDDDTILDLIEEMDKKQYEQHYMDSISNFKIPDFNNNDVGTSSVNIRKEEMAGDKKQFSSDNV